MEPKYIKISDLNRYIKAKFDLDKHLNKVYLKGEISNFKNHTRGHLYFTLKDDSSRISAVMFSSSAKNLKFKPIDGMSVLITGRVAVYEANGGYQIYVESMEQDGVGNLYLLYEELKKKLASEGLFDETHKLPIPKYPNKIGIITASTGAAIKDILSTIKRRYPICETILFPCLVQGVSAAPDIVKNLKLAQNYDLDVIICGRGGGSIEDMWAFNEEIVAREIYNSKIPIISAVGHEVDFTIADFVASRRAPTPTGAAEMAVPNMVDVKNNLNQLLIRTNNNLKNILNINKTKLQKITDSYILKNPLGIYEVKELQLDNLIEKSKNAINIKLENNQLRLKNILSNKILLDPLTSYQKQQSNIDLLINKSTTSIKGLLKQLHHKNILLINTLELTNPLNIISNGYSITYKDDEIIKDINSIKVNDEIKIKIENGLIKANVKEVINGK